MKFTKNTEFQQFETPNAIVTPIATPGLGTEQVSVIHQRMEDQKNNPTHAHTTEEVMIMLYGLVSVNIDGEIIDLTEGDSLIIPANTPHSIENTSGTKAEWLIISPTIMQFYGSNGEVMTPEWAR